MKVLFILHLEDAASHLIPLIALNKKIEEAGIQTAYILYRNSIRAYRYALQQFDLKTLSLDHKCRISSELPAYIGFSQKMIVDDTSLVIEYAIQKYPIVRITILCTGIFLDFIPRNLNCQH